MARFELSSETHAERTIVVAKLIGQADSDTIAKLSAHLAALAAHDPHLRALLDEADLRPGLILPQDISGIVEGWRSMTTRDTVRIAVFAPNPILYGLTRLGNAIASRDAEGVTAVFSKREKAIAWLVRE